MTLRPGSTETAHEVGHMHLPTRPTALLLVAATLLVVYPVVAVSTAADVLYLVVILLCALAAAAALPSLPPAALPAARLGVASIGLYWVGDVIWFAMTWTGHDPNGSLADIAYLSGYAALGAMLVVLLMPLHGQRRVVEPAMVIDLLTISTVCALVLWELVVRDESGRVDLTSLGGVTTVLYPVVDSILIGLAVRALTQGRVRGWTTSCIAGALVCWLVADYGYLLTETGSSFSVGSDLLWMSAALLIAVAVTRLRSVERHAPTRQGTMSRLVLAGGPLLVPPALVFVDEAIGRDPENMSLVIGTVVLVALAFARTERLLAFERQTLRELAATRDAALEASRAKSTFLAGISHEIRTPMNGVLGLSRLLATTDLDEQQTRYVDGIGRAGGSLMDLLNSVLDFARYEDGEIPVDAIDLDILEVVEDVAEMLAEQARQKGLELVATCDPEMPRGLRGDPTKLRQVLLNLASNAVKFTDRGEVVISVKVDDWTSAGPVLRLTVSDTGIGIDPADHERLFTAFTRVDESSTAPRGGTGLGLAIVRELATAMGGTAGVQSTLGSGSAFWCRVPLSLAQRKEPIVTRPSRVRAGLRVLVVDDNASSRAALAGQLAAWDLDVDRVAGAARALELATAARAEGRPYALVLADLDMPGMDGIELARGLRSCAEVVAPALVLMGTSDDVPASALREAGIDVVLPKPVRVSRLHGAVQRALGAGVDRRTQGVTLAAPNVTGKGVVLVVEDSEVNRMVAVGTLRQLGYLTESAVNGAEAVEMASRLNYDAVLMDCRMPVMDGYQATREIRAHEQQLGSHRVPVVAVTANAVAGDRERCLEAGMDDYLVKPLGRKALADTLVRWVSQGETTSV